MKPYHIEVVLVGSTNPKVIDFKSDNSELKIELVQNTINTESVKGAKLDGIQLDGPSSYYFANNTSIIATGSTTTTNIITCSTTSYLTLGLEIMFSKTIGTLNAGQSYYVRDILSETTFTLYDKTGNELNLPTINEKIIMKANAWWDL